MTPHAAAQHSAEHSTVAGVERTRGFTLVEVLVAILVFAVGVLVLAGTLPRGMHRVSDSSEFTHASILASETAERLLATPYDDSDLDAGAHVDAANPHDGNYHVRWTVEDSQPMIHCKRVTIHVYRPDTPPAILKLGIVLPRAGG